MAFNLPPGALNKDYDEREVECPLCCGFGFVSEEIVGPNGEIIREECPRCLGQGTLNASEIRPEEK